MKRTFFSFAVGLLALSLPMPTIHAKSFDGQAKMVSKSRASLSFFEAKGFDTIPLVGTASASYTPLTFPQHRHQHGDSVKAKKNGSQFVLEKGSYLISFTGDFQGSQPNVPLPNYNLDLTFQVGNTIFTPYKTILVSTGVNTDIFTISQIVHLDKKSVFSVLARNLTPTTIANATLRNLSIVQLR